MPDPARAHYCRGAHWTFDPVGLAELVAACKAQIPAADPPTLYAASFDHALKDPVQNDIPIEPSQR
jgi:pantothenate kinase